MMACLGFPMAETVYPFDVKFDTLKQITISYTIAGG